MKILKLPFLLSEDVYRLFQELSFHFVHHKDIRYENIVRIQPNAPDRPMTLGPSSPWRIVDLADCMKHNCQFKYHYGTIIGSRVQHLLSLLPAGFTCD